jgi:hypothetical protein
LFETRKAEVLTGSFQHTVKYYICKDDIYYPVKSKASVLKVFRSHKKELNDFIRAHRLNFRRQTEASIVAVVQQYESLSRQP